MSQFVLSSSLLPKKCQGNFVKVIKKQNVGYLKFGDDFDVEMIIRKGGESERWELTEFPTGKVFAYHNSEAQYADRIRTPWNIVGGKKGLIKFAESGEVKKGKKRSFDDDGKKNVKRVFGRKVSQECQPIVARSKPVAKRSQILPDNIDSKELECDTSTKDDELYVTCYVKEIVEYLREDEMKHPPDKEYLKKLQTHLSEEIRETMLNWMCAVVTKYEQSNATYHLSVNIFDRYLSLKLVPRNRVQLVGCVCLWLAAKYIEVQVPAMDDFVHLGEGAFTGEDMLEIECEIVNALDFRFTVPTPLNFAERYAHIIKYMLAQPKQKKRLGPLINFFIEYCALIYPFVGEPPSKIAAAAAYAAAVWLDRNFHWNARLEKEIGYTYDDLKGVVSIIKHEIYEKKREKKPHVVDKYKTEENEFVSMMKYAKDRAHR